MNNYTYSAIVAVIIIGVFAMLYILITTGNFNDQYIIHCKAPNGELLNGIDIGSYAGAKMTIGEDCKNVVAYFDERNIP